MRNLFPDAGKPPRTVPPRHTHTDVFEHQPVKWPRMFSSTYQSLPESLVLFLSASRLSFSDTLQLAVRWSGAVDRGVCPLISKHSQGAYGEKAPLNIPSIAFEKVTLAWPTVRRVDINR